MMRSLGALAMFVVTLCTGCKSVAVVADISVEIRESDQQTSISAFKEDHLELVVLQNGKEVETQYFYSSYGMANAEIEKDAQGSLFILVRHGIGRGTHVRQEYVTVYRFGKHLETVITFPIAGPAGMESDWEYKSTLVKPKVGGLQFDLDLKLTGEGAEFFPSQRKRTIVVR